MGDRLFFDSFSPETASRFRSEIRLTFIRLRIRDTQRGEPAFPKGIRKRSEIEIRKMPLYVLFLLHAVRI